MYSLNCQGFIHSFKSICYVSGFVVDAAYKMVKKTMIAPRMQFMDWLNRKKATCLIYVCE